MVKIPERSGCWTSTIRSDGGGPLRNTAPGSWTVNSVISGGRLIWRYATTTRPTLDAGPAGWRSTSHCRYRAGGALTDALAHGVGADHALQVSSGVAIAPERNRSVQPPAGGSSPTSAASPHSAGWPASRGGEARVPWGLPERCSSRTGPCVSTQSPPAASLTTCDADTVSSWAAEPSTSSHSSPSSPVPITRPIGPHASVPAICLVNRWAVMAAPSGRMRTISEVAEPFAVAGVALAVSLTDTATVPAPASLAGGLPSVGSPVSAAA
ncbi:MAG: hypothetical protein B7Z61_06400 [Acidobacteria bacterium 37-71-11]|nr:MAG: hypothetical protein B7Z61_06400 [Acidobacteria bacterium 37-71-11]